MEMDYWWTILRVGSRIPRECCMNSPIWTFVWGSSFFDNPPERSNSQQVNANCSANEILIRTLYCIHDQCQCPRCVSSSLCDVDRIWIWTGPVWIVASVGRWWEAIRVCYLIYVYWSPEGTKRAIEIESETFVATLKKLQCGAGREWPIRLHT